MNKSFARTLNHVLGIGLPGAVVDEPTLWRRSYQLDVPVHLNEDQCRITSDRFRVRRGERPLIILFYPAHLVEHGSPSEVIEGQGWTIVKNFGVPGLTMTFEPHNVTLQLPAHMNEEACKHANHLITALALQKTVDIRFISDPFAVHAPSPQIQLKVTPPGAVQLLPRNNDWEPSVDGVDVNQVMHLARPGFCIWQPSGSGLLMINVPIKADMQECQRRTEDIRNSRANSNGRLSDKQGWIASFPLAWQKDQRDSLTTIVNRAIEGWSVQINFVPTQYN